MAGRRRVCAGLLGGTLLAGGLVLLAAFPLLSDSIYFQNVLILTFLLAIGASGWNIMGGYAGYISLGNSAFIGLGGVPTGTLPPQHHPSPLPGGPSRGVGWRRPPAGGGLGAGGPHAHSLLHGSPAP